MKKRLVKLYRLIRMLGIQNTFRIYFVNAKAGRLISLKLKNHDSPIFLRACTSDLPTFESIFLGGHNIINKLPLKEPKIIIDIGANIGLTAITYAKKYPSSRVYAIEAEKSNYEMLLRNVESYSNIFPLHKAFWYKNEKLTIKNPSAEKWAFNVKPAEDSIEGIEAITLNDIISLSDNGEIDLMKIDVEGAEKEIFEHINIDKLYHCKVISIELHDRIQLGCSRSFYAAIINHPYREIRNYTGDHIIEFL